MPNGFMEYGYDKSIYRVDRSCFYHESELWIREEGKLLAVGATDFLQINAGDMVLVELPDVGRFLQAGDQAGVLETARTTIKLIAPVSGRVKMVNSVLVEEPELINSDAYGEGWVMRLEASNWEKEKESLMKPAEYYPIMESKIKEVLKSK